MDKILFAFLLMGGLFCGGLFILCAVLKWYRGRRYGRLSSSVFLERYAKRIYCVLARSRSFVKINNEIAYKISIFNSLPFETNRSIGAVVIVAFSILLFVLSLAVLFVYLPYWYIAFAYIIFIDTAVLFALQLFSESVMNRYLKRMPEALKILQPRFLSKGSISKAIQVSIPDLPKGIKAEMIRIYDAMKQNELEKTRETFKEIDKKYTNEHMSVLLDLIWLAHYNGGTEAIQAQFDAMVKNVLEDLENQQDLRVRRKLYYYVFIIYGGFTGCAAL